ncbi:MAG: hypothetical protein EXR99_10490 [Gemmataceae bacterium]|nr:hypothetical protein [Gemmataceae bacterium]
MIEAELLQAVSSLRQRLTQARRRELLLRFIVGLSTALLIFLPCLVLSCLGDWFWDLTEDTPRALRTAASISLGILLAWLFRYWLALPFLRTPPEDALTHWVENTFPDYNHQLVTVMQLARPEARMEGQSPVLLSEVTRKVVEVSQSRNFLQAIDHGRLKTAAWRFLPSLAVVLVPFILFPEMAMALVARQLGLPHPIPRNTQIVLPGQFVLPEGEEGVLEVGITSRNGQEVAPGKMIWHGLKGDRLELALSPGAEGKWEARVSSMVGPGSILVRAGDGRAGPIPMKRMARPVLELIEASVKKPAWYGLRPDGSAYEDPAPKGDIVGMVGSLALLKLKASQPLATATLTVLPIELGIPPRSFPCKLAPDKMGIEVEFSLLESDYRYHVRAVNQEGLSAIPFFQRRISVAPEEPPVVQLLPEQLPGTFRKDSTAEDSDIDGLPVLVGQRFRVGYRGDSPGGIRNARFRYRINEKGLWRSLPLQEFQGNAALGEFHLEFGAFEKSSPEASIDFYALPSTDKWKVPDRRQAGGRFDFQIGSIKELKIGDRIEFFVEATDLRPGEGLTGQSETRVKEVVGVEELLAWWRRKEKETEKLTELKNRQGRVFEGFLPESKGP